MIQSQHINIHRKLLILLLVYMSQAHKAISVTTPSVTDTMLASVPDIHVRRFLCLLIY